MRNLWKSQLMYALACPVLPWGFSLWYYHHEVFAMHNRLLVVLFVVLAVITRRYQVRRWQVSKDRHALELVIGLLLSAMAALIMVVWMDGSLTLVAIMLLTWVPFFCYLWESPFDLWLGELLEELFPRPVKSHQVHQISVLTDDRYVPVNQLLDSST